MSEPADFEQYLRENAAALASNLALPPGFLRDIEARDDDWSFVIKLHALFEAALGYYLANIFGKERFFRIFSATNRRLAFRTKLRLARQVGALGPHSLSFLEMLSRLRNELVHDVGKTSFTFKAFVEIIAGSGKSAEIDVTKQQFVDALSGFWPFINIGEKEGRLTKDYFVFGASRMLMFYNALNVLAIIYCNRQEDDLVKEWEDEKQRFREKMIAQRKGL